jgi:RNA polymerase sigma-70 factor (ECF subfamily)
MLDEEKDRLHRFREGDESAFEQIFRLHQRAVYGWVLRIVRDPAAAEDLTVESFWRIYQARARFDPSQGFEGWARRIASRAALDWLRAVRPTCALPDEASAVMAAPVRADPATTAEIRARTAQAFAQLSPKLRIAATLALIEEVPQKEIAAALGISLAAVKLRVFRAVRQLRKDLERQGITP